MITIVSTNKDFINAHAEQFREYLGLCRSALKVHRDPQEFLGMFLEFYSLRGDVCQKTLPLSTLSMSAELVEKIAEQSEDFLWKDEFLKVAEEIPKFEQRLLYNTHIDISPLDCAKDIAAGKVPVASPYQSKGHPCYTPETYIMHLKNILRLMDTYKNYTFIPLPHDSYQSHNLMVNDGGMALLSHGQKHSPMIMEFHRPEIVLACKEHLMRVVDKEGGLERLRSKTKTQLKSLISELKKASNS